MEVMEGVTLFTVNLSTISTILGKVALPTAGGWNSNKISPQAVLHQAGHDYA